MTIHTPIESPCRDDKRNAVFKNYLQHYPTKKCRKPVKMPKNRLFEIKKKSEKKVKTQMCTKFFRDLHLIS